jgi:poly-gamma-glutamate synthesis protein (capsule biosynthesis protein)
MTVFFVLLSAFWLSTSPATAADGSFTLAFSGDIMLGRGVKRITDTAGLFYPFAPTRHLFRSADLAIGNLESPLTAEDYKTPSPWKFKGDTSAAAVELRRAGFGLLALANNHAPDCGEDGFYDSQRFLEQAGVLFSGRGDSFRLALPSAAGFDSGKSYPYCLPTFMTVKGVRIGFLSFCEAYLLEISKDYGGNLIARADSATVVNSIKLIRDRCHLVICSFHWGQEYQDHPNAVQKKLGRLAIRAGADIVHGHHPHVLQGVEFYQGGLIAYSLGNFIFDQRHVKPRQSGLLFIKIATITESDKNLAFDSVSLVPLEIINNRPQPASPRGWKAVSRRFTEQCRRLGTSVEKRGDWLDVSPGRKAQGKTKRPG